MIVIGVMSGLFRRLFWKITLESFRLWLICLGAGLGVGLGDYGPQVEQTPGSLRTAYHTMQPGLVAVRFNVGYSQGEPKGTTSQRFASVLINLQEFWQRL
jgi:hypothetical protein